MSIKLKYKDKEIITNEIFWDRDSIFLDSNGYWSRVAGTIAQLIAESSTDNWSKFDQTRTQSLKLLGVNIETGELENSSPLNILPTNLFHFLIANGLRGSLSEKTLDELNLIFSETVNKSLIECQPYIKSSIKIQELETIKEISKSINQVLITNDTQENNDIFIKETNTKKHFSSLISQTNKETILDKESSNSIFVTKNIYLKSFYERKKISGLLLIENIQDISFEIEKDTQPLVINIDGASKGNPGPASIGIAFYKNKELLKEVSEAIGNQTNNYAEYTALIRALEISLVEGYKNIEILSDSELVVKQVNKIYKVKDSSIKNLYEKVISLLPKFSSFKITHIPREENSKADKLANNALLTKPL